MTLDNMTYLQGAFILTLVNLVTGILSFIYRIFLSKSIGAEGMGVYQLIMPLYILFIQLVSGGLSTSISKLVAENKARHNYSNIGKTIKIAVLISGLWSVTFSSLIAFNAGFLANNILNDERTFYSVIIFSPAIIFIALAAVLKGYFYGTEQVKIPALIDIAEKLIRLVVLIMTTNYLIDYGIEYICAGAMTAMVTGELLSLFLLYITYRRKKIIAAAAMRTDSAMFIISNMLKVVIPLSISGAVNTILDMLDAALIPDQLIKAGFTKQLSLSLYGQLTGMVLPLIYFPMIIIGSLSITLIPSVAFSFTYKNWAVLNKKYNDSLTIASIIGLGATIAFMLFPKELCSVLFNCPQAGKLLFWSSIPCVLEYWLFVLMAIMNGLNFQGKVLESTILNIIIMVTSIIILMPMPRLNIYGYVIGLGISSLSVILSCLRIINKNTPIRVDTKKCILKPILCAIPMLAFISLANFHLTSYTNFRYNMMLSYILGSGIYAIMLLATGTIRPNQLLSVIGLKKPDA